MTLISQARPPAAQASRFGHDAADASALARLQASSIGRFDADLALRSDAEAAAQTAQAISLREATIDDALNDRAYGAWAGRTIEAVAAAAPEDFARWLSDEHAAPPGGESVVALTERAAAWLGRVGEMRLRVVAITHPSVIRACLVVAMAAPPLVWFRLDIGYGTRTELTCNGGQWRVALVNGPLD